VGLHRAFVRRRNERRSYDGHYRICGVIQMSKLTLREACFEETKKEMNAIDRVRELEEIAKIVERGQRPTLEDQRRARAVLNKGK